VELRLFSTVQTKMLSLAFGQAKTACYMFNYKISQLFFGIYVSKQAYRPQNTLRRGNTVDLRPQTNITALCDRFFQRFSN
jgi:hypothetical protein